MPERGQGTHEIKKGTKHRQMTLTKCNMNTLHQRRGGAASSMTLSTLKQDIKTSHKPHFTLAYPPRPPTPTLAGAASRAQAVSHHLAAPPSHSSPQVPAPARPRPSSRSGSPAPEGPGSTSSTPRGSPHHPSAPSPARPSGSPSSASPPPILRPSRPSRARRWACAPCAPTASCGGASPATSGRTRPTPAPLCAARTARGSGRTARGTRGPRATRR